LFIYFPFLAQRKIREKAGRPFSSGSALFLIINLIFRIKEKGRARKRGGGIGLNKKKDRQLSFRKLGRRALLYF